jgi:hypothetical protein
LARQREHPSHHGPRQPLSATIQIRRDALALAATVTPDLIQRDGLTVVLGLDVEYLGRTRVVGPGQVQVASAVDAEKFLTRFRSLLDLPCR